MLVITGDGDPLLNVLNAKNHTQKSAISGSLDPVLKRSAPPECSLSVVVGTHSGPQIQSHSSP